MLDTLKSSSSQVSRIGLDLGLGMEEWKKEQSRRGMDQGKIDTWDVECAKNGEMLLPFIQVRVTRHSKLLDTNVLSV
jgi:hypothetical protein